MIQGLTSTKAKNLRAIIISGGPLVFDKTAFQPVH